MDPYLLGNLKILWKKHEKVAIKITELVNETTIHNIANEIKLLELCHSNNIVSHIKSFMVKKTIWTVMEYCDGGNLKSLLKVKINESQMAYVCQSILRGMQVLHSYQIVHRDIKSENVLLNLNGTVKIADLGLSTKVSEGPKSKFTIAGSRYWMAPEILRGEGYGIPVDIWSLGCVIIEMMYGIPPYYKYHALAALFYTATKGREYLDERDNKWSNLIKSFLDECFQFKANKRPTAEALLENEFIVTNFNNFDVSEFKELLKAAFMISVTQGFDY